MVNALTKNFSQHTAGKYGKCTKQSTLQHHQGNEGKSGLEAERVRAVGAFRSSRSKKALSAEKWRETQFLSKEEKQKWTEDYVERETAVAGKRVQDAATVIMQEQEHMSMAENVGATTSKPKNTLEAMLNAIGESLSDLASSDDEQDGNDEEDDEENTELSTLTDDDEPGWVMGTISKTVQHCMESIRQKKMRLDKLTHPGWRYAAYDLCQRDMKYETAESKVRAVVKPQIDLTAATPSPITFGEYADSWHRPLSIANAGSCYSTKK